MRTETRMYAHQWMTVAEMGATRRLSRNGWNEDNEGVDPVSLKVCSSASRGEHGVTRKKEEKLSPDTGRKI